MHADGLVKPESKHEWAWGAKPCHQELLRLDGLSDATTGLSGLTA